MNDHDDRLVTVIFQWSTKFGYCLDCDLPAAYCAPNMYPGRNGGDAPRFCSLCAAEHAADGNYISRLFPVT